MSWLNKDYGKFYHAKANAKRRGIPFQLSFEQWFRIWKRSGHYSKRGKGRGKYVMARKGDIGPYAVGNVKIILNTKNVSNGHANWHLTESGRRSISEANSGRPRPDLAARNRNNTGKPLSPKHRRSIAKALLGKKRGPYRKKVKNV